MQGALANKEDDVVPYSDREVTSRRDKLSATLKTNVDRAIRIAAHHLEEGHGEVLEVGLIEKIVRARLESNGRYATELPEKIAALARWLRAQPGFNTQRLMRLCPKPTRTKPGHPCMLAVREAFLAT